MRQQIVLTHLAGRHGRHISVPSMFKSFADQFEILWTLRAKYYVADAADEQGQSFFSASFRAADSGQNAFAVDATAPIRLILNSAASAATD